MLRNVSNFGHIPKISVNSGGSFIINTLSLVMKHPPGGQELPRSKQHCRCIVLVRGYFITDGLSIDYERPIPKAFVVKEER